MIIETIDIAPAQSREGRGNATLWGATMLLVRRRIWRDRGHLLASIVIVAMSTLIALGGPQVVLNTIDDGARDAVDAVGDAANIDVLFPVGNATGDNVQSVRGAATTDFAQLAAGVPDNLPGVVAALAEGQTSSVISRQLTVDQVLEPLSDDADVSDPESLNASTNPDLFDDRVSTVVQFAMSDVGLMPIEGRLPADPPGDDSETDVVQTVGSTDVLRYEGRHDVVEVALTQAVSETLDIPVGSVIEVSNAALHTVALHVVGIVVPADPDDPAWDAMPEALAPVSADNPALPLYLRGTVVVSQAAAESISATLEQPFDGVVTVHIGSSGLTLQGAKDVSEAMKDLVTAASSLIPGPNVTVTIESGLGPALDAYPPRARAALAQMSVMVAGVIGVAAVTIALMARLLLGRRREDIALERARGASVPSISLRLAIEAAVFAVIGVALGYYLSIAIVGRVPLLTGPVAVVGLVALFSAPLLGAAMARRTWTGKRAPANRQDRAKQTKAKAARRWTLDSLAIVVAAVGVTTLQSRGVLQTQTKGIDPFLAAAPALLALGTTVLVLRLFPAPLRLIQSIAKRTKGVAGVITLAKARGKIPVLPLVALTLAVSIAVSGGLLVATVRNGQEQASWERIGGEVRIEAELPDATIAELEAQGLTVSRAVSIPQSNTHASTSYAQPQFLAIDESYPDIVAAGGVTNADDLRALLDAAEAWRPGDPIPALATQDIIKADFNDDGAVFLGRTWVHFTIFGEVETTPDGWANAPYVIMPLEPLLTTETSEPVSPNLVFVNGPSAAEAVAANEGISADDVTTRAQWLDGVRQSALIGGVERMMTMAVLAVALLAAVSLLVSVLDGVHERGVALAMLRTQGMGGGYGWWLALGELLPLTTAGVVGGTIGGLAILFLLGRALGLQVLAGGIADPPPVADPVFLGVVCAGIVLLLLLAVSVEVTAQRRNKLSEVLRLGETR